MQQPMQMDWKTLASVLSYHHHTLEVPRAMYQLYQDSMAICRALQKPDIFLTMTANPQWPEIIEALKRTDGPDQKVGGSTRYCS